MRAERVRAALRDAEAVKRGEHQAANAAELPRRACRRRPSCPAEHVGARREELRPSKASCELLERAVNAEGGGRWHWRREGGCEAASAGGGDGVGGLAEAASTGALRELGDSRASGGGGGSSGGGANRGRGGDGSSDVGGGNGWRQQQWWW